MSYRVRVVREAGAEWQRCEQELLAAGVPVPLPHRLAWARAMGPCWLIVAERAGYCRAALAVEVKRPRALPGHSLLRADRIGCGEPDALPEIVEAFAELARGPRVVRAEAVAFSRDPIVRERIGEHLARLGFRRESDPQAYRRTTCVDLSGEEAQLLSRLSGTARRHIAQARKAPVELAVISDLRLVPAMTELTLETRARTGGSTPRRSLAALIELAKAAPDLVHVVGLFAKQGQLLAFATGHFHGDHVTYAEAASTRNTSLRISLGYAPAWELMRWGRSVGARWFEFGGITAGGRNDAGDPLGGISHFKRMFQGEIVDIADEWVLVARPRRAAFMTAVSRLMSRKMGARLLRSFAP